MSNSDKTCFLNRRDLQSLLKNSFEILSYNNCLVEIKITSVALSFIYFILLQRALFFKEMHILVDMCVDKITSLSTIFWLLYSHNSQLKFVGHFTQRTNAEHKNR